ncbi:MAG: NADP-dependent malic enzyme, partial [uncultured Lysobacter sp.]
RPQARRIRRRRRGNRAARGADRDRRAARVPDPDRPAGRDRKAHRAPGPAHARGRGFRADEHQLRPALRRILADVSPPHRTPRRHPGSGEEPAAFAHDADRRAHGRTRRSRCDAVRHRRPLPQEARLPAQRVRFRSRCDRHRRDERRDQRPGRVVLPRHACAARPDGRADRRSDAAGQLPPQAVRRGAERRAAQPQQFRQPRQRVGGEDAPRLPAHPPARAQAQHRRRDAGRYRLGQRTACAHLPEHLADRAREPVRVAESRCGEHHLQPDQGDDRWRRDRSDPHGPGQARAHPHAGLHGASRGEHDRACGRGCADPRRARARGL